MSSPTPAKRFRVGDWLVDPATDSIARGGQVAKLEPRTMRVLECLAQADGAVVSSETLLNEVWSGVIVGPASVYQAISQLRRILGDVEDAPKYIATVSRKGYRLVAPIVPAADAASLASNAVDVPVLANERTAVTDPPAIGSGTLGSTRRKLWWTLGLMMIGIAGVLAVRMRHAPPPPARASEPVIVVLPFVDLSADHKDQALCDGLTEELSNWLAQIPTLKVVARTSAFSFRDKQEDVRSIGRALGTTHALEGSMRRAADFVRVTVQLIDTRTGLHTWSAQFDDRGPDAVRLQENIARSVADNLELRLSQQTSQRLEAQRATKPEAYRFYLLAKYHQQERTRQSNAKAIEMYLSALSIDESFAPALVGLAYAYLNQYYFDARTIADVSADAEPLLARARQIDSSSSDLYAVVGALRAEQGQFDAALENLRRAIHENPNNSRAASELGRLYIVNGRPREALQYYDRAAQLDPLDGLIHAQRCVALTDMARYEEAADACAQARSLQPRLPSSAVATSWLEWSQGHLAEALRWNQRAISAGADDFDVFQLRGQLLATLSEFAEARQVYEHARATTQLDDLVDMRMSDLALQERGLSAFRQATESHHWENSSDPELLLYAAYAKWVLKQPKAAGDLVERALRLPGFDANSLIDSWMMRWGESHAVTIAAIDLDNNRRDLAFARLEKVSARLATMEAAGVQRWGLYYLRSQILSMRGAVEESMRTLNRAADHGWRDANAARQNPCLLPLRQRADFQALLNRIDALNSEARRALKAADRS